MDFGDIFHDLNLEGPQQRSQRSSYDGVPEAPGVSDIPDINSLFGSGDTGTLLELRASQWLPATQHKLPLREVTNSPGYSNYEANEYASKDKYLEPKVSERGDSQEIYLGSQFPIVKKVRQSDPKPVSAAAPYTTANTVKTISRMKAPRFNRVTPQFRENTHGEDHIFETPAALILPATKQRKGMHLRSVLEIQQYRAIFKFQYFNIVQSKVFDDVLYTDRSVVVCSPTGSGKTAIFEMAIIRLLTSIGPFNRSFKVVYMAPIKALCSERYQDWKEKFEPLGLKVMELTGDTDLEDFYLLQEVNIILTTPEKWDSMTRKWRDNKSVVQAIYLFLVDEIHILNDETRGATVEAVLSRMKTIQAAKSRARSTNTKQDSHDLRFVAASATLTNIEDIAAWLGTGKSPALHHKFDDQVRPVRLRKVVLGYNFNEKQSPFQFDITLNYKLAGIINTYSENKPTLVFCSTRKGVTQAADTLAKDMKSSFVRSGQHRQLLQNLSFHIKDSKLRDLVMKGIGYHHAGMDFQDRKNVEEMFSKAELPVLVATSTLAMGVNLPAHLVIIKSTMYYNMGCHEDYSDTQVLQMIGRAGRPQFDTSATAVIMTKHQTKEKYDNLLNGTQLIESNLHKNLIEHLNAEIVLGTITDMSVALEWLKFTFLYIRVMKNPRYYGMPTGLTKTSMEKRLQDMCMKNLNQLLGLKLLKMNEETLDVSPTDNGRLMARYCISYRTAELFNSIKEEETIADLLSVISKCKEFEDIKLRINERKTLNTLNKDKHRATIRYPLTGKIKSTDMKVNCLIQAQLGSLLVQDFALQQDTSRIFRVGTRIMRCLVEFLSPRENIHGSLLSAIQLCKAFKAQLWENSKFVSKQLEGIGPTLSNALVNAGLNSFEKIEQTNPREIELIVNRHPPFGNQVRDSALDLPKYALVIEQIARYSETTAGLVISLEITNRAHLKEKSTTGHTCILLIGDKDNRIVLKQRVMDSMLLKENTWTKRIDIQLATKGAELDIHYISQDWVGLDIECTYTPIYIGGVKVSSSTSSAKDDSVGVSSKAPQKPKRKQTKTKSSEPKPKPTCTKGVANYLKDLKEKSSMLLNTPSLMKRPRLQFANERNEKTSFDLTKYGYTPKPKYGHSSPSCCEQNEPSNFDDSEVLFAVPYNTSNFTDEEEQNVQLRDREELDKRKSVNVKSDWPELDLYQRHREICRVEEAQEEYYDIESLPDLDVDQTTESENIDTGYNHGALPTRNSYYNIQGYNSTPGYNNIPGNNKTAGYDNMPGNNKTAGYDNMPGNNKMAGYNNLQGYDSTKCYNMMPGYKSAVANKTAQGHKKAADFHNATSHSNATGYNKITTNICNSSTSTYNNAQGFSNATVYNNVTGCNNAPGYNNVATSNCSSSTYNNATGFSNAPGYTNATGFNNATHYKSTGAASGGSYNNKSVAQLHDYNNSSNASNTQRYDKKEAMSTLCKPNYGGKTSSSSILKDRMDLTDFETDVNEYSMVQETDYGCVYAGGDDPVIDWDDRVTEDINKASLQPRSTKKTSHKDDVNDEVVDDIQCYESDGENHELSKWTSYFSSQSSTASDYLRSKCPARYDTNRVVMEDRRENVRSRDDNIQDVSIEDSDYSSMNRSNRERSNMFPTKGNQFKYNQPTPTSTIESSRKYGQVLAWISNSQPKDLDFDNWSDDDNYIDLCGDVEVCDSSGVNTDKQLPGQTSTNDTDIVYGRIKERKLDAGPPSEMTDICVERLDATSGPPPGIDNTKRNWSGFFANNRSSKVEGDFNNIFDGLF